MLAPASLSDSFHGLFGSARGLSPALAKTLPPPAPVFLAPAVPDLVAIRSWFSALPAGTQSRLRISKSVVELGMSASIGHPWRDEWLRLETMATIDGRPKPVLRAAQYAVLAHYAQDRLSDNDVRQLLAPARRLGLA